jgi:2,4'-dihydroxyacetophenone dioxygenase
VAGGSVEYLGAHHRVLQRITTADRMADCHRHCASMGVHPCELT